MYVDNLHDEPKKGRISQGSINKVTSQSKKRLEMVLQIMVFVGLMNIYLQEHWNTAVALIHNYCSAQ